MNRGLLFRLRLTAFLEGLSFIVLLGIAMPLKYAAGRPEMVRITGMIHGILFVAYIGMVLQAKSELGWSRRTTMLALVASVLPFGTFWADARLFRPEPVLEG